MYKILTLQAVNQALNMNLAKAIKTRLRTLSQILELCLRRVFQKLSLPLLEPWCEGAPHGGSLRTHYTGKPLGTTLGK